MREKLANLEEVVQNLKGFLPQYLAEHEIDTAKNFACLNPKHEDSTASMSCAQNPENAYCFGCGCTADIFQTAHWLEDKPIEGPGFIQENVKYLAEKYGVQVEFEEMTEDELYRFRTYRAYEDAAFLITNPKFGPYKTVNKEIKKRGWKHKVLQELRTGTVEYREFRDTLRAMGYEARFQDEIDLGRPDIFDKDNMIFTICDEWGRPVGFAARNLKVDKEGKSIGAKYKNQKTTGLKCNIYQKGRRLYQIHTARKFTPPLYIFEGYTDVTSAVQAGLLNSVAIGGTAFTDEHVDMLKRLNIYDIVLVLDGDKPGQDKTADLLDERFCGHKDMKVSVINLPDGQDPDDFFRAKSLEEFLKLKKWSAFEWRLNRYPEDANDENICKTMIPLIVNEPSYLTQDTMCGALSQFTGVDKRTIKNELERLQNLHEREKQREKADIIERHFSEIKRSPEDAKSILIACASQIELVEEKYNENALSQEGFISFIEAQRKYEEALKGEFAGFNLSPVGLKVLGEKLNGNWREDVFMCIGGAANSGKTSLCCQLAYEIASHKDNDACVIYHTIDDSAPQLLPRFVVQGYGKEDLTINQVRNPLYYLQKEDDETVMHRRKTGYDNLMHLVKEGRLILKDANDGASFAFGESLIRHYMKKYPTRNIVYILDNLHKTPDYAGVKELRQKFTLLSNHMKETATKHHITVIATVEYTKIPPKTIPHNNNIAETRSIIYDASFIGHLYNDHHEAGDLAYCVHEHNKELHPRIRLGIGKNKISDFKGRVFLDMYPSSGLFKYVSTEVAESDMRLRKKMVDLREGGKSYDGGITKDYQSKKQDEGDKPQWPQSS